MLTIRPGGTLAKRWHNSVCCCCCKWIFAIRSQISLFFQLFAGKCTRWFWSRCIQFEAFECEIVFVIVVNQNVDEYDDDDNEYVLWHENWKTKKKRKLLFMCNCIWSWIVGGFPILFRYRSNQEKNNTMRRDQNSFIIRIYTEIWCVLWVEHACGYNNAMTTTMTMTMMMLMIRVVRCE